MGHHRTFERFSNGCSGRKRAGRASLLASRGSAGASPSLLRYARVKNALGIAASLAVLLVLSLDDKGDEKAFYSAHVHPGPNGKLIYAADELGNTIPDFSNCGYHGGGVAIPATKAFPICLTLRPAAGDATARIQSAIDEVCKLPPDARGIRGAVLLS